MLRNCKTKFENCKKKSPITILPVHHPTRSPTPLANPPPPSHDHPPTARLHLKGMSQGRFVATAFAADLQRLRRLDAFERRASLAVL